MNKELGLLSFPLRCADWWLGVVACVLAVPEVLQKESGIGELYGWRDSSNLPVMDALNSAFPKVIAQELCHFGGASKAFDELPIRVGGGLFRVHC